MPSDPEPEQSARASLQVAQAEPEAMRTLGLWALVWRRFRRHRLALLAAVVLLLLALSALLAPWIAPYNPDYADFSAFNSAPTWAHPMGTDLGGRDVLSRVLYGGRISLLIGLCTMIAAVSVGTVLGALAGYFGGWVDTVIMRLTDVVLSFPLYLILFVLAAFISGAPGWENIALIVVLLMAVSWTSVARLVRAEFLALKEREFVQAAQAVGAGPAAIILRQLLPNAIAPIVVNATLLVGSSIILESVLSFFGFGVQPPTASWGSMLADGRSAQDAPWETIYPGLMILLTVLSVNLLGDGLRDALDPFSARDVGSARGRRS
jgi:ABC-type dipeptide/oligopeptide/nickel transport system permease subunit